MKVTNLLLIILNAYFILSCLTVERNYCASELKSDDTRLLMKETYEYAKANNPLFFSRPEWLRNATCISSYGLVLGYVVIVVTALTDTWNGSQAFLINMFVGAKVYALFYYHFMEFTDPELAPWNSLGGYWAAESPYLIGIGLTTYMLLTAKGVNKIKYE